MGTALGTYGREEKWVMDCSGETYMKDLDVRARVILK